MRTYKQELQHLYKSEFIRSFAEIDPDTGEYKRDISEADIKTLYLCDGKKCGENHDCGECAHTSDITHALNFKYDGFGGYWEQPTINLAELEPLINKLVEVLPDLVNACIQHIPEYIEAKIAAQDPETVTDKCPFDDKPNCIYYPDGCGKCTYND